MPHAKTEVALQFFECCAAETALQHSLFCSEDVICTKSCAAANEKLHCNIEIAALQESGAFLPLSCGFQAPTFRHPRFGLADHCLRRRSRGSLIFFAEEIAHLGASKNRAIFWGAVKIAAAAAENGATLVHSGLNLCFASKGLLL